MVKPLDVFLPKGDELIDNISDIVQPDTFVVCDDKKLLDIGVLGAPDFVIEVLDSVTAMKDQTQKRMLYEVRGVREYWIVNPETFELFMYFLEDGWYGLPSVAENREATGVRIFPGLALRVRPEDL